jgi:hypothetical protein
VAVSIAQLHNHTAISVSARLEGWYAVIRSTRRLANADGKRTILSFIYLLLFKAKDTGQRREVAKSRVAISASTM